jgi:hypothetical protein
MALTATITEITPQQMKISDAGLTASRVFDLAMSSGATEADIFALVGASGGLPMRGDAHPTLSGAEASSITIQPDGGQDWTVTVDYLKATNASNQPPKNDLSQTTPVVRTSFIPYEYPVNMLNSAHEAFDPPPIDVRYNLLIDVQKYYAKESMTPSIADSLINTVNSGTVSVGGKAIGQGSGLIRLIDLEQNIGGDSKSYTFAHIQIEVSKAESGWTLLVRDQGLNQLSGTGITPCLDIAGTPVADPVRLNGSGVQLAGNTAESGTKYISKQVKDIAAWDSLALPSGW